MRRIGLAVVLAFSLAIAPLATEAQQAPGKIPRIGYLSLRSGSSNLEGEFRQGLCELGSMAGGPNGSAMGRQGCRQQFAILGQQSARLRSGQTPLRR